MGNMKVLGLLLLVGGAYCVIPSCTTVWEDKCWDEPRQKCNTIQVPHEVTSYEEKCSTEFNRSVALCGIQRWTTSQEKSVILFRFPGLSLFQRRSVRKYLKRSVKLNMKRNVTLSMNKNVTLDTPRNARLSMRM